MAYALGVIRSDTSEMESCDETATTERGDDLQAIKRRRRLFLYLGTAVLVFGFVFAVIGLAQNWLNESNSYRIIGGYCAIMATFMSVFQVMEHLTAFTDPDIQSRIIRILVMVPLYAVTSWLAMTYQSLATVLDLVRDSYESYAIYTFFSLMMGLLGGTDTLIRELMAEENQTFKHPWPFGPLKPFGFTPTTLHRIRISILQFMVLKPLCGVIIIILDAEDKYKNPNSIFDPKYGYVYLTVIYNISITLALYGLMYFYISTRDLLKEHKPFMKFVCIKGVLFLSYWQSFLLAILGAAGVLPEFKNVGWKDRTAGLQDFLICCEMLLFAIAHKFVFGAHEYSQRVSVESTPLPIARSDMWKNLVLTLKHEDVRDDFKDAWTFQRFS
ncbi:hypothetical protein DIPPA_03914 [Diplonema papillatum]|nr:hypothetical protein DIPPA_03914 [Diplonema papillatum]